MDGIETLKQWVMDSDNIVFFGGAGVSTESGIPDFRSVDGLYNQKYDYPPETILSHSFYIRKKKNFIDSTGIKCCAWMQSLMQRIRNWQSLRQPVS